MTISRKNFIKKLIQVLLMIEAFFIVKGSFRKPSDDKKKLPFDAGEHRRFTPGQIYSFASQNFFLKRFSDGSFLAMSSKCTHLGCVVNSTDEGKSFICPCHSSHFDEYGNVLRSPALRPLDLLPMEIKDGRLYIDVHNPIRRQSYHKSQLLYV